jgi:hypothetical protein
MAPFQMKKAAQGNGNPMVAIPVIFISGHRRNLFEIIPRTVRVSATEADYLFNYFFPGPAETFRTARSRVPK